MKTSFRVLLIVAVVLAVGLSAVVFTAQSPKLDTESLVRYSQAIDSLTLKVANLNEIIEHDAILIKAIGAAYKTLPSDNLVISK